MLFYASMMVFTVSTGNQSSRAISDKLCALPYLRIFLIFISKPMAVCLRDRSLFPPGAHLQPTMAQNMKASSDK
jgi:hypothetical protein